MSSNGPAGPKNAPAASGKVANGKAASGKAASGKAVSGKVASGKSVSGWAANVRRSTSPTPSSAGSKAATSVLSRPGAVQQRQFERTAPQRQVAPRQPPPKAPAGKPPPKRKDERDQR